MYRSLSLTEFHSHRASTPHPVLGTAHRAGLDIGPGGNTPDDGADPDLHDPLVRLLRTRKGTPRLQGGRLRRELDDDPHFRQTLMDLTGGWTVPQILIDDRPVGGYAELWALDRSGQLDDALAA